MKHTTYRVWSIHNWWPYKDEIRKFGWRGDLLLSFCAHEYMEWERQGGGVGMATVTHARNVYLSELVYTLRAFC